MADYAGAEAAIEDKLRTEWTTTPVFFDNEPVGDRNDNQGRPTPWVLCEITQTGGDVRGAGQPGNNVWLYDGLITVHVFVPRSSGRRKAREYAWQIGEIFRAKAFYGDTPGHLIRTWTPRIDAGGTPDDEAQWYRRTVTIDFDYWHTG